MNSSRISVPVSVLYRRSNAARNRIRVSWRETDEKAIQRIASAFSCPCRWYTPLFAHFSSSPANFASNFLALRYTYIETSSSPQIRFAHAAANRASSSESNKAATTVSDSKPNSIKGVRKSVFISSLRFAATLDQVNKVCDSFLAHLASLPPQPPSSSSVEIKSVEEYASEDDYRRMILALIRVGELDRATSVFTEMCNRLLEGKESDLINTKQMYGKLVTAIKLNSRNIRKGIVTPSIDKKKKKRIRVQSPFFQRELLAYAAGMSEERKADYQSINWRLALDLFQQMKKGDKKSIDVATYNFMAHILNLSKKYHLTRNLYKIMMMDAIDKPNTVSYINLFHSYFSEQGLLKQPSLPSQQKKIKQIAMSCVQLVREMLCTNVILNGNVIAFAARAISLAGGDENLATQLFEKMKEHNIPIGLSIFEHFLFPSHSPQFQLSILKEGHQLTGLSEQSLSLIFKSLVSVALEEKNTSTVLYFTQHYIPSRGSRHGLSAQHNSSSYLEEGILQTREDMNLMMLLYEEMKRLGYPPPDRLIQEMILAASKKKEAFICQRLIAEKKSKNQALTAGEYYAYLSIVEQNLIQRQTELNATLSDEKQILVDGLQAQLMTVLLTAHTDGLTYLTAEAGKTIVQFSTLTRHQEALDALRLVFRWIEFEGKWLGDKSLIISIKKEIRALKGKHKDYPASLNLRKQTAANSLYSLYSFIHSFLERFFPALIDHPNKMKVSINDKEANIRIDERSMIEWSERRRRIRKLGVNLVKEDELLIEEELGGEERFKVEKLTRRAEVGMKKLIQVKVINALQT